MRWFVRVSEGIEDSLEFLNRHRLEMSDVKICAYHVSLGLNAILVYYRSEHELE